MAEKQNDTKKKLTFGEWIDLQNAKRGWKPADLARASGLDTGVISNLRNNKRQMPAVESCRALSEAYQIPVKEVFIAAGILNEEDERTRGYDPLTEAITFLVSHLNDEEKQDILDYARFKSQGRVPGDQDTQHPRNRKRVADNPAQ